MTTAHKRLGLLKRAWNKASRGLLEANLKRKNPNVNIFHCCIQKSASQWIKQILLDPVVMKQTGMSVHVPGKDFIGLEHRGLLTRPFPEDCIVSPLYIRYDEFLSMPKPEAYKAFWVMRDPRDLIVSRYFSIKISHRIMNEAMETERQVLAEMSIDEGLSHFIDAMEQQEYYMLLYSSLTSWLAAMDNDKVKLFRYEELTGPNQGDAFSDLFSHLEIDLPRQKIDALLATYSFEKMAGRAKGSEDVSSHYRKGISGDWRNYFKEEHTRRFKEIAGQLLIEIGYEPGLDW